MNGVHLMSAPSTPVSAPDSRATNRTMARTVGYRQQHADEIAVQRASYLLRGSGKVDPDVRAEFG